MNIETLWARGRELRAKKRENRDYAYRQLIELYDAFLGSDPSDGDRESAMQDRCTSQLVFKHLDDARASVIVLLETFPDSVMTLSYASSFYALGLDEYDKGLSLAQRAVALAGDGGDYTIYSLNELCRIARHAGRFDVMQQAMRSMLATHRNPGLPFQDVEGDYLRNMPEGAVPDDLLEAMLVRSRKK